MSRYIDADAIKYDEDLPDIYTVSKTRIDNMPTADVRENVKGEWHDYQEGKWIYQQCSVCGYDYAPRKYPFCPNCGADMRGET